MGLPFVGETFGFFTPHKSFSIGNFLQEHRSRYGEVFKSNLFGSPTIVSCDLEFSIFVLQNEGRLFQSSYPKSVRDILGKHSLMLVTGDLHKKFRSIETGIINKFKCKPDFLDSIDKLCTSLMESWTGNQVVLFSKEAKQFSFNLMLMNVLDMEPGEPLALQLLEDFLTFMKGFVSIPINLPWTSYAKALKARTRIASTLKQVLNDRKKRKDLGINELAKEDIFNENLLKGHLSDVEKVSILQDLLLAGYETTSGLLSLLVYFLAQSPQALQYLKNEHRALRRTKKEGEPLNWEDYKQMKFTSMVINETLRCGYHIPAGWKVLPILSSVHLDPSLHQNPSEFNPWRWADPTTSKRVIPFGGGLRLCPGWELAKLEAALFLHHLVINYRWTAKEDDHPMLYPYLEFPKGLLMTLEAETRKF
ncbi:PREDICTED: cytochrome P450 724B1-like [Nicotiana attenuata]|uniref:cytochrome P450 724B1-like n=1 Tax=Nicotiana attenuata TaxID=49451 RepID=UPI000904B06C|nr:PREDICTED: cytochrome P450 724B1-like [Nicotiana attenuata]